MSKVTVGFVVKSTARRLFLPGNWRPLLQRWRQPEPGGKSVDDAQLKLFGQILPAGFLNYGHHENTSLPPEKMSLDDIEQAQVHYGERLERLVVDRASPVLDSGCGMGGLTGLLLRAGLKTTALTPNRTQIQRVRTDHPSASIIQSKLEQIPLPEYRQAFGTVITAESFQYVKLEQGLTVIEQILRPGGRWILSDYFRTETAAHASGHRWTDFTAALRRAGWRIVMEEDITANVLPTIAYVHMWGRRLALPAEQFVAAWLRRKNPVLHYLMEKVLLEAHAQLQEHMDMVDPAIFGRDRKYVTLVLQR